MGEPEGRGNLLTCKVSASAMFSLDILPIFCTLSPRSERGKMGEPSGQRGMFCAYFPYKSYRTLYNWQRGKINPLAIAQLVEVSIAFTKQYGLNSQDITTMELFESFLSKKKRLTQRVKDKIKLLSNSALHHKMNLNIETISLLRNGDYLHFAVLKRLDDSLN
jgi:hypothetical protein